jgi:hypothetical protein
MNKERVYTRRIGYTVITAALLARDSIVFTVPAHRVQNYRSPIALPRAYLIKGTYSRLADLEGRCYLSPWVEPILDRFFPQKPALSTSTVVRNIFCFCAADLQLSLVGLLVIQGYLLYDPPGGA